MGRRTSSTDASGTTTFFHYDGWNVVAGSDSSGTIIANYYYDTGGQIMAMKRAGQTYYYQFNAHGDVVSLTDSSGTVVNTYAYDPWGSHLTTSETVSNPFRYAGYRWDEGIGLYYLRARYYSAGLMRFLTKDLFKGIPAKPETLNNYTYAMNNPLYFIDPSGLMPEKGISWEPIDDPNYKNWLDATPLNQLFSPLEPSARSALVIAGAGIAKTGLIAIGLGVVDPIVAPVAIPVGVTMVAVGGGTMAIGIIGKVPNF